MIRQEILVDLLQVLEPIKEELIRGGMVRLVQTNLKAGRAAVEEAGRLWPQLKEATELVQSEEVKESVKTKHLKLFGDWDRRHARSLELLQESFSHIEIILGKIPSESNRSESRKER